MHKYKRELRNPPDEHHQSILNAGISVGELARQLFKYGVDATPPDPYSYHISVAQTKALIDRGVPIIYEAAFQYEGVMCAIDILVKQGEHWYAFEVKSTTSVKNQHIEDAALQYYVMNNCGVALEDISIIHLNNAYVRKGELNVHHLFSTQSILEEVLAQQHGVVNKIIELKTLLGQPNEPVFDIGPHCLDPYECDFTNHCWSHIPKENSIFDLPIGSGWKLYAEGYKHLNDIPEEFKMSGKATMQLAHFRSGQIYVDREALMNFLKPLTYPLFFFDFETIMPGIPEFDDSKPYQQIPFQFSLHVKRQEDTTLEHYAFLGDGLHDPRLALIKEMIQHLGQTGSIVCYNMSFEKTRIKDLSQLYPEFEEALLAIKERIVDLMIPFQQRWYYHPSFKGSYSIKSVLPVLVPGLNYNQLDIKEGGTASLVYSQLKWQNLETNQNQRMQLLAYCEMDTLAMVRILERLQIVIDN